MNGKIIVITGGPRTGKSTLVKLIAEKLGGVAFLEGEEKDFPKRIWEDIQQGTRVLELMIWFRNKLVKDYLEAVKIKESGGVAVLDIFWLTNDVYVDEWVTDEFEKDIIKDMMRMDRETLPWPDLIFSLYSNEDKIKEFAISGGREFELNDDFLQKQIDLNDAHEKYFRNLHVENIKFIDRSQVDFSSTNNIDVLIEQINNLQ